MAKQVFKGFKQVYGEFTAKNGYLYFVRTNDGGTDGYLLFNGKKYGSAEDVYDVLNAKIGTLPSGYTSLVDYINDQISGITEDYATNEALGTLSGRVDNLEAISAGTRLDTLEAISAGTRITALEAVSASTRLTNLEASAATFATIATTDALQTAITDLETSTHTHSNKDLLDTYTQTDANLADAVSKKHEHSNKSVLDGITAEKVADWDEAAASAATKTEVDTLSGSVVAIEADYLTSSDKTALEGTIGTLSGSVVAIEADYLTSSDKTALEGTIGTLSGRVDVLEAIDADNRLDTLEAISADTRLDALEALSGDSHTHSNKSVLDGITAEKVADWDGVAGSADTRISALEAISADTRLATIESGYTKNSVYDAYTAATNNALTSADTRLDALEELTATTSSALQEIVTGDTSVTVGAKDASNKQTVAVKVSNKSDNALELISDNTNDGLYVMPIFYYEEGDALPSE